MDSLIRLATLPGQDWRSKQLFQWRHEEPFSGAKPKFVLGRYFWPNKFSPSWWFFFASKWRWMTSSLSRFLSLSFLLSQLSQAKIKSMLFTLSLRPLVTNNNNSSKKCELNWWTPAYYIVFNFGTDTYSFLTSWNRTNLATEVLVNKRPPSFFCCL